MKRLFSAYRFSDRFGAGILFLGLLLTQLPAFSPSIPAYGEEENGNRIKLYLINPGDFPPPFLVEAPQQPERQTQFLQSLDMAMQKTEKLSLVNSLEKADYQVRIQCAGTFICNKLSVKIASPNRDVLVNYFIPADGARSKLPQVADFLAQTLDTRIRDLQQGQVGAFGFMKPGMQTISNTGGKSKSKSGLTPAVDTDKGHTGSGN